MRETRPAHPCADEAHAGSNTGRYAGLVRPREAVLRHRRKDAGADCHERPVQGKKHNKRNTFVARVLVEWQAQIAAETLSYVFTVLIYTVCIFFLRVPIVLYCIVLAGLKRCSSSLLLYGVDGSRTRHAGRPTAKGQGVTEPSGVTN